ncbi:MAG: SDR family NAD(P)-dependent oxidoreductase [Candidatus Njordarchaeia archaeon]
MIKGKTVVVTGASRGIGKAIALKFGKEEANVVINYLNSEDEAIKIKETIDESGGRGFIVKADIRDIQQVERMVNVVLKEFGAIHILINNVGDYQRKDFLDVTQDDWNYIMEINFYTTVNMIKAVLPTMIKQNYGRIVNISSTSGVRGSPRAPHYAAAKAALIGLTKSLAKAYGQYNITINNVAPGPTNTDLLKKWFNEEEIRGIMDKNPMKKIADPEDVAEAVLLLALNNHINGQTIVVSGGDV